MLPDSPVISGFIRDQRSYYGTLMQSMCRAWYERLHIAEETVKVHVKHIMEKLGAHDRAHAFAIAARRGFIQL